MKSSSKVAIASLSVLLVSVFLVAPLLTSAASGPIIELFKVQTSMTCYPLHVNSSTAPWIEGVVQVFVDFRVSTTEGSFTLVKLKLSYDVHNATGGHLGGSGFDVLRARPGTSPYEDSITFAFSDHDPVTAYHFDRVRIDLTATDGAGTTSEFLKIDKPDCTDN